MNAATALLTAQSTRFERLDALLPPAAPPPDGRVLTTALADGTRVAGVLVHAELEPGTLPTLWSAMLVWELYPLLGEAGAAGMAGLLREFRGLLADAPTEPDSACVVTWPSRDASASKPLLALGFTPLSSLAVRTGPPPASPGSATSVRLADAADLDVVVGLELAELSYSTLLGATPDRPDAPEIRRAAVARHLEEGEPMWLAERDGVPLGLAHCRLFDVDATAPLGTRLRPGRWGYVNSVSVLPRARGAGVGRDLMAVVHRELHGSGATGTFLYYHPVNPLASVFWARQGYRPLWTGWELRPATAFH
jgi:GNAT superfamily N-acetyltransferase